VKKYLILISGVAIQMILGSIYAWSELALLLSTQHGLHSVQTQSIYGIAIGVFAAGTILTGRLLRRVGPRVMTLVSAALFAAAYGLAGLSSGGYLSLVLTLGPLLGLAIASGYVVPLSTATSWFPNIKGTVTGLAVMGFGGGAILASFVIRRLAASGMDVQGIFPLIGIGGAAVLALAGLVQAYPEEKAAELKSGLTPRFPIGKLMGDGDFWSLYATMFMATLGGLLVIGGISNIAADLGIGRAAALGVSVLALGNSTGRLFWGSVMDRLGRRSIPLSLVIMAAGFLMLRLSRSIEPLFLVGAFLTGFQFGASLVLYGAYTERHFGDGAISSVYPLIFTAYGLAALVGPTIGGLMFDLFGSYDRILIVLSAVPLVALLSFAVLKTSGNVELNPERQRG
jgi:OFA family oxalate/formate antiporter-like MFS transporter